MRVERAALLKNGSPATSNSGAEAPRRRDRRFELAANSPIVVRTPRFPLEVALELLSRDDPFEFLVDFIKAHPEADAAILIASRSLHDAFHGWLNGKDFKNPRARIKLLMYLIRMASRSTPFGLFSGVGSVEVGNATTAALGKRPFFAKIRLDSGWLYDFVGKHAAALEHSDSALLVANDLRLDRGGRTYVFSLKQVTADTRDYPRTSIRATEATRLAFAMLQTPMRRKPFLNELSSVLDAPRDRVERFVDSLIAIGAINVVVMPGPTAYSVPEIASRLESAATGEARQLVDLSRRLTVLEKRPDALFGCADFENIRERMQRMRADHDNVLQIDLGATITGSIGERVLRDVSDLADIAFRMGGPRDVLAKYRERFVAKYEGTDRLVPLLELVDSDFGIGSPEETDASRPLSDESLRSLARLAMQALRSGSNEVVVDMTMIDALFPPYDPDTLPPSFEMNFYIEAGALDDINQGNYLVGCSRFAGTNAIGRSVGRFSRVLGDDVIARIASDIPHPREAMLAEITYLPRFGRSLNVLLRSKLLATELQVGFIDAQDIVERVSPADLSVGISGGRFFLWSRKHERRVEVRESHLVHSLDWAPSLIRFLTMLSGDGRLSPRHFNWGTMANLPFKPRLRYKRLILSPAFWLLDLADFRKSTDKTAWLNAFKLSWNLPEYGLLRSADRSIPVKLDHPLAAQFLLSATSPSMRTAMLSEWLPSPESRWLRSTGGAHAAELIASFVSHVPIDRPLPKSVRETAPIDRRMAPSSDWTCVHLFCGERASDEVCIAAATFARSLIRNHGARKWFFIRYGFPSNHIRLRIQARSEGDKSGTVAALLQFSDELVRNGLVNDYGFYTYNREIERYGGSDAIGIIESVFYKDCDCAGEALVKRRYGDDTTWYLEAALSAAALVLSLAPEDRANEWLGRNKRTEKLNNEERDFVRRSAPLLGARSQRHPNRLRRESRLLGRLEATGMLRADRGAVLSSLVHMHFNRLGVIALEDRSRAVAVALVGRVLKAPDLRRSEQKDPPASKFLTREDLTREIVER